MGPLTRATLFCDFSEVPLDQGPIDWKREVRAIVAQRMAAVAMRLLESRAITTPEAVRVHLQDATYYWTESSLVASTRAVFDLEILTSHEIRFVVTKGPGIARYAAKLAERPFTDIDIFIEDSSFGRVRHLLESRGYFEENKNLVPRDSLDRKCREAVNLRSPNGGSIDVHHRLPPWYWSAAIEFDAFFLRAKQQVVPGGGKLPCASAADNLLVSALHIVSDKNSPGTTLMAWRDFLLLAREVDPEDIVLRARAARLTGWVKWVMDALPSDALEPSFVAAFADEDPQVHGAVRLRAIMPPGFGYRHRVFSQMFRLPVPNAAAYLLGLAWPSPSFLDAKVGQVSLRRLHWWRQMAQALPD